MPSARDFTAPPTTAIPPDYRINPGDELLLGMTGSVQASGLRLVVDSEGRIFVPRVGAIAVDRKSVVEGKRVAVRVDIGGRRITKKKIKNHQKLQTQN